MSLCFDAEKQSLSAMSLGYNTVMLRSSGPGRVAEGPPEDNVLPGLASGDLTRRRFCRVWACSLRGRS